MTSPKTVDYAEFRTTYGTKFAVYLPEPVSELRARRVALEHLASTKQSVFDLALYGFDLQGAKLDGLHAVRVALNNATLAGASLRGAHLTEVNLTGAEMAGVDLTGAILEGCTLTGAKLTGASLVDAQATGGSWRHADLTDADATDSQWHSVRTSGSRWIGVRLDFADCRSLEGVERIIPQTAGDERTHGLLRTFNSFLSNNCRQEARIKAMQWADALETEQ